MEETWKDIPNREWYKISNLSNVKSFKRYKKWIILKKFVDRYWYISAWLCKDGKNKTFKLHRLVLLAFIWPSELECNHKDWNPLNNNLENLEYCTRSENLLHRHRVLKRNTRYWKSLRNWKRFEWEVWI